MPFFEYIPYSRGAEGSSTGYEYGTGGPPPKDPRMLWFAFMGNLRTTGANPSSSTATTSALPLVLELRLPPERGAARWFFAF
jgi:hypothetical protein